jgi:hypothetical protein
MVFYVIVLVQREVDVVMAEVDAFYVDRSAIGICLLLMKGSVLERVQRNTHYFSEWLFWLKRPNKFSLIGIGVILTSFFDFVLSESRVFITKINLLDIALYFLDILRNMLYFREYIPTVTSSLW